MTIVFVGQMLSVKSAKETFEKENKMNFKRRSLKQIAAAFSLSAALVAPTFAEDIVWARYGDIDSLDPHRATSTLSLQVWSLIYDTLLAMDAEGNPVPHIAKSWSSNEAGTEYTFSLEAGVMCLSLIHI